MMMMMMMVMIKKWKRTAEFFSEAKAGSERLISLCNTTCRLTYRNRPAGMHRYACDQLYARFSKNSTAARRQSKGMKKNTED